jgi:hypothetical protein
MTSKITREDKMISKEKKSTNTWMTKLFTVQMPENRNDFT